MEVTVKQAEKIRCCGPEGCGVNVLVNAEANPPYAECEKWERRCAGTGCMGWQWFDGEYEIARLKLPEGREQYHFPEDAKPPKGDGWELFKPSPLSRQYRRPHTERRGQCGLANFDVMVETQ